MTNIGTFGPSEPGAGPPSCIDRPVVGRPEVLTHMRLLASQVNLNHPGQYLNWGVVQISYANLTVIGIMLVLFLLALILPFPKGRAPR